VLLSGYSAWAQLACSIFLAFHAHALTYLHVTSPNSLASSSSKESKS
jgi:hypothetical protein